MHDSQHWDYLGSIWYRTVVIYLFFPQQWQQFCATASTTCWRQTPTLRGRSPGFVTQMQVNFFNSCLKLFIPTYINPINQMQVIFVALVWRCINPINVQLAAQQSRWRHWTSCARRGTLSTTFSQRMISSRLRWVELGWIFAVFF